MFSLPSGKGREALRVTPVPLLRLFENLKPDFYPVPRALAHSQEGLGMKTLAVHIALAMARQGIKPAQIFDVFRDAKAAHTTEVMEERKLNEIDAISSAREGMYSGHREAMSKYRLEMEKDRFAVVAVPHPRVHVRGAKAKDTDHPLDAFGHTQVKTK